MKRVLKCFTVCVLMFSMLAVCVLPSAAVAGPTLVISSVTAVPLDTVTVTVNITENPGIMAMTFTLLYDNSALTFKKYKLGVFNDYTIVDHPESGYVSFVNCESANRKYKGTVFSVIFTVNETASPGLHPITLGNINPEKYGTDLSGCFANWDMDKIEPTVISGGVTVGETCLNAGHKYSEWETVVQPLCEETGTRSRSCTICGHTENEDIPALGHTFEEEWTVDRPAQPGVSGIMSRHCKRCDAVTDKVYFSFEEANDNDFSNQSEAKVKSDQWEKLEEIAQKNEQGQAPDYDKPEKPENNSSSGTVSNADEIVKSAKEGSNGRVISLYRYLFGTESSQGVLSKIAEAWSTGGQRVSVLLVVVISVAFMLAVI